MWWYVTVSVHEENNFGAANIWGMLINASLQVGLTVTRITGKLLKFVRKEGLFEVNLLLIHTLVVYTPSNYSRP